MTGDATRAIGGLATNLLLHGDIDGALAACAHWWGAAATVAARETAATYYVSLWKHHGGALRALELSRRDYGHWRVTMLGGADCGSFRRLAAALRHCAAPLEVIDLANQFALEGPALEVRKHDMAHKDLVSEPLGRNRHLARGAVRRRRRRSQRDRATLRSDAPRALARALREGGGRDPAGDRRVRDAADAQAGAVQALRCGGAVRHAPTRGGARREESAGPANTTRAKKMREKDVRVRRSVEQKSARWRWHLRRREGERV